MNYATERVSERCQIKAKRQGRATQGSTIETLRGIVRTCLKINFVRACFWCAVGLVYRHSGFVACAQCLCFRVNIGSGVMGVAYG